jgi:hypothetical protein
MSGIRFSPFVAETGPDGGCLSDTSSSGSDVGQIDNWIAQLLNLWAWWSPLSMEPRSQQLGLDSISDRILAGFSVASG